MQAGADGVQVREAADTLAEVALLQRRARTDLTSLWFPLTLFGALTLSGGVVALLAGAHALGSYWAVAGPLGGIATGVHSWRRERELGLEGPALPYVLTGAAILLGCFVTGGLGAASARYVVAAAGPPLVVAAGLLMFAWLERSRVLAVLASGLAAVCLGLVAAGLDAQAISVVAALVSGAGLLATGLLARRTEHPRG